MNTGKATLWSRLALIIVLLWTLLPIYWFLKISLLTPDEIARFPPPLYPLEPTPAAFFNIFGLDYTLADGSVRLALAHLDPGHPNWLETAGHARGTMCLRFVGAREHPQPRTRVETLPASPGLG